MIKKILKFSVLVICLLFSNAFSAQNPGAPDGGLGPMNPTEPCGVKQTQNYINNDVQYDISFNAKENILYKVRDDIFYSSIKGKRYIEHYYYISKVEKKFKILKLNSLKKIINLMPLIYSSYEKYINPNYAGVIIDAKTKEQFIDVLNIYLSLSDDSKYKAVILELKNDLKLVEKMNKSEIKKFMEND